MRMSLIHLIWIWIEIAPEIKITARRNNRMKLSFLWKRCSFCVYENINTQIIIIQNLGVNSDQSIRIIFIINNKMMNATKIWFVITLKERLQLEIRILNVFSHSLTWDYSKSKRKLTYYQMNVISDEIHESYREQPISQRIFSLSNESFSTFQLNYNENKI